MSIELTYDGDQWESSAEDTIPAGPWGLYDTVDNCWMGDDNGPKLFYETGFTPTPGGFFADLKAMNYGIARVASEIVDRRLNQQPGRTRVRTYDGLPKTLRETVPAVRSTEQALTDLEEGRW